MDLQSEAASLFFPPSPSFPPSKNPWCLRPSQGFFQSRVCGWPSLPAEGGGSGPSPLLGVGLSMNNGCGGESQSCLCFVLK